MACSIKTFLAVTIALLAVHAIAAVAAPPTIKSRWEHDKVKHETRLTLATEIVKPEGLAFMLNAQGPEQAAWSETTITFVIVEQNQKPHESCKNLVFDMDDTATRSIPASVYVDASTKSVVHSVNLEFTDFLLMAIVGKVGVRICNDYYNLTDMGVKPIFRQLLDTYTEQPKKAP